MHFSTELSHLVKSTSENGIIGHHSHHQLTIFYIEFSMFFAVSEKNLDKVVNFYPSLSRKEIRFSNMHPASQTRIPLTWKRRQKEGQWNSSQQFKFTTDMIISNF